MELFQLIRKIYKTLGVSSSSLHHNQNHPINAKILIIVLPVTLYAVSSMIFLLFKAKTSQEYADTLYWITSACAAIFAFLQTVWKMPMTIHLVGKFEKIIEKSRLNLLFTPFHGEPFHHFSYFHRTQ